MFKLGPLTQPFTYLRLLFPGVRGPGVHGLRQDPDVHQRPRVVRASARVLPPHVLPLVPRGPQRLREDPLGRQAEVRQRGQGGEFMFQC